MQNIVIAQAQSAINGFHQFGIRCHTTGLFFYICCLAGCCFIGICLVQGRESIRHILVDGIEPIYHILVDLLNHLVLGLVRTDPGCGFAGQGGVQFGHIVANGVGRFHDGPILYGGIGLAHILVGSLVFQIFLHLGDAGIQGRIAGFTGCFFRCVSICAGLGFVGIRCIQSSESICHVLINGIDTLYQIFIDLLDHLVLSCISADAGSRFIIQALSQCGHIFADFFIRFHDTGILYRCISLAHIIVPSFIQYIVLNGSNAVIQGLIAGFAGSFLGINIGLELLICIVSFRLAVHVSRICLISQLGVCFRLAVHVSRICLISQLGVCFRLAVHISRICLIGQLVVCFRLAVHISRICLIGQLVVCFRLAVHISRICLIGQLVVCFRLAVRTICGVHRRRLRSSARIHHLDRHGGVRGPGVIVVDGCEQHGGYGCSCGGCAQAGVHCFRVGFGVLRHDDVAVLCLAPNDFEDPVHKMTSPFELLMIR